MVSQKLLPLFVLLVFSAALADCTVQERKPLPKDVIIGYRESGDYIVDQAVVKKQGLFLGWVKFEKTFVGDNHSIITQIRLKDLNTRGEGAVAKVITGGPGNSFVTLSFRSMFNGGINYSVEIYGKAPAEE